MQILDFMQDRRSNCYSIMVRINVDDYLELVTESYKNTGNIEGQRLPIASKTGKRIRDIMISDIESGAILPPIVLGCVVDREGVEGLRCCNSDNCKDLDINRLINSKSLSIIDGMQRTTALIDIKEKGYDINDIRLEIWVTDNPNNLIYRMLVLNTGQISWSLKKQLEVVFSHVSDLIKDRIPEIKLYNSNDNQRSKGAGEYQLSHIVELYLAFSTRKENLDLNKEVTERFAKLDIVDLSSRFNNLEYFVSIFERLVRIDMILDKNKKIKRIFGDQHARTAFLVSISKRIFGKASIIRNEEEVENKYSNIISQLDEFIKRLDDMHVEELESFCAMDTFNEITAKMDKVEIIEFYKNAFNDMVESNFDILSFEECWRAE